MLTLKKTEKLWSLRLFTVCFVALCASLPMAWVSLSKLLLFTVCLVYLSVWAVQGGHPPATLPRLTSRMVLLTVCGFAISIFWTEVDSPFAIAMLVKHAKLLQILLLCCLIRNAREAKLALKVFVYTQVFVLVSSWLLAAGVALPWVKNDQASIGVRYVVFSESYLDQSIMFAVLSPVIWHVRPAGKWWGLLAGLLAIAAILNVLALLPGRTGHLAILAVVLMALAWGIPKRARRVAVLLGSALITVLLFTTGFENVSMRASKVIQETHEYTQHGDTSTSSGWRINAWHRSIQAIQAQPLTGYGVGSWSPAVKRLDGDNALRDFGPGNSSNPHQEYLLWGVELGSIGPLLLVALFVAMAMDAKNFPTALRRATFSAIAVTAIACLFNSSLYDALIGDFLCTTLGLLMALGLHRSEWQK